MPEYTRKNVVHHFTIDGKEYFFTIDPEATPKPGDWIAVDRCEGEGLAIKQYGKATVYYGVCRFIAEPKRKRVRWPKELAV